MSCVNRFRPVVLVTLLLTSPASGQDEDTRRLPGPPAAEQNPTPSTEEEESLLRAKSLFRQGVAVYEAGGIARAADYFRRSREEYPSARNTINEALCLDKLGRFDEALELYEQAIARFSEEMDAEDRAATATAMATLRAKVGEIEISSNVTGSVLVGSRLRGRLPLSTPLRVLPGRHVVRVLQEGYMPFETDVEVIATQRQSVDARLSPLAAAGGLRVEDTSESASRVLVDGAEVGPSPWEGMLAPGVHVVQVQGEGLVSMPSRATVVQGQTVLARLRSDPLAGLMKIRVSPPTAEIFLEGVPLGKGDWEGWLPAGDPILRVQEEGYFPGERRLFLREGVHPQPLELRLAIDQKHPRWPPPPKGRLWISPWLGGALGPSLRSGAEAGCPTACPASPPAYGFLAGLRMGYELPFPLSFEVSAGYLSLQRHITRTASARFPTDQPAYSVNYELDDVLRLKGPMFGGGASYGANIEGMTLRTRMTVGMLLASSYDVLTGKASTEAGSAEVIVDGSVDAVTSRPVFFMPEIGVETRALSWDIGGAVGVLYIVSEGPPTQHRSLGVSTDGCSLDNPGSVGCAPAHGGVARERAYGPMWMLVPQISARYVF